MLTALSLVGSTTSHMLATWHAYNWPNIFPVSMADISLAIQKKAMMAHGSALTQLFVREGVKNFQRGEGESLVFRGGTEHFDYSKQFSVILKGEESL